MANGILDFFSREAGQQRRKALDEAIEYYTPPNLRGLLGFAAEVTPTRGIERAGQASQELFAPGTPGWDRVSALGDMASEIAGVVAPAAVAGKVGMPAAQALQEGLLGISTSPQATALRNFAGDESGALRLWPTGAETPEGRAQGILDLLTSGRASEVTDEMLDLGDPVANARLNQYLFRNYDLPMDEASRMARMNNATAYHGTTNDILGFNPNLSGKVGVDYGPASFASGDAPVAEGYAYRADLTPEYKAAMEASRAAGDEMVSTALREGPGPALDAALARHDALSAQLRDVIDAVERGDVVTEGANVMPLSIDTSGFPTYAGEGKHFAKVNPAAIADARAAGAKGAKIENVVDAATTPTQYPADVFSVFDPSRIRSRFARFDPRLAHLKNLSAGVVAAPLGLLALRPQEEQY